MSEEVKEEGSFKIKKKPKQLADNKPKIVKSKSPAEVEADLLKKQEEQAVAEKPKEEVKEEVVQEQVQQNDSPLL